MRESYGALSYQHFFDPVQYSPPPTIRGSRDTRRRAWIDALALNVSGIIAASFSAWGLLLTPAEIVFQVQADYSARKMGWFPAVRS